MMTDQSSSVRGDIYGVMREAVRGEVRDLILWEQYEAVLDGLFLPMRISIAGGVNTPIQNWMRVNFRTVSISDVIIT